MVCCVVCVCGSGDRRARVAGRFLVTVIGLCSSGGVDLECEGLLV